MKKLFYSCLFFAAMAMTTSCSQDEEIVQQSSELTTFKVELDGATKSRTAGDGQTVNTLYYAVYDNAGENVIYPSDAQFETAQIVEGKATVNLPLMKSEKYNIVFWAQYKPEGNDAADYVEPYTFEKLTEITVNYPADMLSNRENRDAFFNSLNGFRADGNEQTVYLKRPFAQLNVATHIDDWNEALRQYQANGSKDNPVKSSSVTISNLAEEFNAMTGEAKEGEENNEPTPVTFAMADLSTINESITINKGTADEAEYKLLAMNYVLMAGKKDPQGVLTHIPAKDDEVKATEKVEFTLWKDEPNSDNNNIIVSAFVPNVPIQRNYRTNIIGSFLTGDQTQFNIVVDADFDREDNNVESDIIIDDVNKMAHIYNLEGLKYFRDLVNGEKQRSRSAQGEEEGEKFDGYTFFLENNINLNEEEWKPIGSTTYVDSQNKVQQNKFYGIFDGKGYSIEGLKVENILENEAARYTAAGLFGILDGTVRNLTINKAKITDTSNAGKAAAIAGSIFTSGSIENVKVIDVEVIGNRYLGGIAGYVYGSIKDCTVDGITLTATPDDASGSYDNGDKVGGIAGYWACESTYVISGNKVNNATIKGYRDLGGIIGSGIEGAAKVTNNAVSNTSIVADQTVNYYKDEAFNVGAIIGRINGTETIDESNVAVDVNLSTVRNNEEGKPVLVMTLVGDMQVSTGTTIHTQTSTGPVTINGNGNTIVSTAESVGDFTWEGGTIPAMSTIFSSVDGSKVTVNDLKFTGTMSALMLGHYVDSSSNWYNTELNNVEVTDAKVVSFSANISPAVVIYGTAVLNNCKVTGTTLSELDTDPMWPVYDLAAVNYSKTTLNNCTVGSVYIWNQAELIIDQQTTVEKLIVRGNMNTSKYGVTIKSGTTVKAIDLSAITDKTRIRFTIENGATVGKFVANGIEYSNLEAYKNAN